MYRWVIAWRWLKRLPILWASVLGVLLGVASILVVDSIFNGVLRELKRVYRGSTSDLIVMTQMPPMERRDGSGGDAVPVDAIVRTLLGIDGVAGAAPRLRRPCLLPKSMVLPEVVSIGAIARKSVLQVQGIVPADESSVTDFRRFLTDAPVERRVRDLADPFDVGDLSAAVDGPSIPILLGDRCALALHLERGSRFELLTLPEVDEETVRKEGLEARSARFVVAGTFVTESFIEDLTRAYVRREDLQRFSGTQQASTEVVVKAQPGVDLETLRGRILERLRPFGLGRYFRRPVLLWSELEKNTLAAIENQRNVLDFILFAIVVVAGFNLLVSLHLMVTEKLRDIGTLAALGGSAFGIASIFTALGVLVTTLGTGLGLLSGALLALHINEVHETLARWIHHRLWDPDVYNFDRIPVQFEPTVIGLAIVATFAVTLLFAFLASLRAARLDPIEALRHE